MKAWFANLQPRERAIFVGGAVIVVLIVLWAAVLRPLGNGSVELRDSVAAKQRLLVNLARVEGLRTGTSSSSAAASGETLVLLVNNTAQTHGLTFPRTRLDGPDGISLSFQDASFDALLGWLVALETAHAVEVESASFSNARQPGLVSGQLALRRF
jgi:general secretion pathway protein M